MTAQGNKMKIYSERTMMQILVIEDDQRLADALSRILEEHDYHVDAVYDGQMEIDYGLADIYDVIICDLMLPKKDGYAIMSELRRAGISTPILMLTARGATRDKIIGYDSGADDYMTKPFSPAELLAHLRALTRRQGRVVFETVETGDLELNLESHDLSCGDKSINLSYKEFSIMRLFMTNPKQIISKDTLISKVWGIESSAVDNNVEAYVSFLRKKLKFLGSSLRIETMRKIGY